MHKSSQIISVYISNIIPIYSFNIVGIGVSFVHGKEKSQEYYEIIYSYIQMAKHRMTTSFQHTLHSHLKQKCT